MDKASTPLKHVILFSDSTDAAEQVKGVDYWDTAGWPSGHPNSIQVVKEMHEKGITVSVIGVGEGADGPFDYATYVDDEDDSDFLRELARVGGGRYYRTTDAKQLRGLFVQDARRLLDNKAREEDITLEVRARHAAIDGLDLAHAPPLHGYQELKPRPAAQVVLANQHGDPMLVRWPYGLGEVAVWTSDAGPRWADQWLQWPGYSRFWTQLARASLRRREGDTQALEADVAGDHATVRVVRRDERPGAPVPRVRISGGADLPLRVVSPGVYEARVAITAGHEPTVELLDTAAGSRAPGHVLERRTLVRPPSRELAARGPDTAALTALTTATGGRMNPSSIDAAGRDTTSTTPLTAWLLLLALLLLPADAALRRVAREP
jgi:Ca-activated chloride channel homolog